MNKLLATFSLTLAATAVLPVVTADAASTILIGKTQYDSPGSDTRANTSLNAEYVTLKNVTSTARSLRGYTLRDAQSHVYTIGTFTLGAGKSVIIHTGKGTNSATNLYWGQTNYIWNNTGDTATLKTAAGTTIDTCRWTTSSPGYTNC